MPSAEYGSPDAVVHAAIAAVARTGARLLQTSSLWRTAPVPASGQPSFLNAVIGIETSLSAAALLGELHAIEARFGRVRRERNEARIVDLDLLDYAGQVSPPGALPLLPHPRLAERAFVLRPLAEIAPDWRHPASGAGIARLIAALDPGQQAEKTSL